MNVNEISTRSLNLEFELDPGISKYKFVDEQQIVDTLLKQRPIRSIGRGGDLTQRRGTGSQDSRDEQ